MWGGKCKHTYLGPFSLGLALGIVSALAVLIWLLWIMMYGVPSSMAGRVAIPTLGGALVHSLWTLLQGFIFGFFIALFYNLFSWCCKSLCHKGEEVGCDCGSSCKCGPSCPCHNKKVNDIAERIRDR